MSKLPRPRLAARDHRQSSHPARRHPWRPLALAAALAVALAAPAAAQKRVIDHETLWSMPRLGSPQASPDGKWVAFNVTEPSYDADKSVSDIWIVPADGSAPARRLTATKGAESDLAWSPNGRTLAFTARREGDEVTQVYLISLLGGEARRLTALPMAAARPQWRPDGQAILFEASVYPGATDEAGNKAAAEERKARKYNMRVYQHFPIRYWMDWIDDRQPSIWVQELTPGARPRDILSPTKLAKTSGFGGSAEGDGGTSLSSIWSPDGKEVLFIATTERWNAAHSRIGYHIYRMPAAGGEPSRVTTTGGDYDSPAFTPDGATLIFEHAPLSQEVYSLPRLHKLAWGPSGTGARGAMTPLTRDFDREAAHFQVTPDSRTVYLLVPEAAKQNLYRVPIAGGRPERVIEAETGGYLTLSIPEKARTPLLIGTWGSSVSPPEIVRIDPAGRRHQPLTNFNTATAASIDWAPPQSFRFTSRSGRDIHNLVVLPPGFDPAKKYPLLVMIHGGPASNNTDQMSLRWNYHMLTAPGYVLLMTDYSGSTGFGEAFAQSIKLDPLKGPGEEIEQAVDEAARRYPFIDAGSACATGASYGGHLTNWLQAVSTRYKCLVSHAGEVNLVTQWGTSDFSYGREVANGGPPWDPNNPIWREQSPSSYAANWKTPMLVTIGERDFRVPLSNSLENWAILQRQKVPSRLLVFPDAGHWILKPEDSRQFYREIHAWFGHYLKGGPALPQGPVAAGK